MEEQLGQKQSMQCANDHSVLPKRRVFPQNDKENIEILAEASF